MLFSFVSIRGLRSAAKSIRSHLALFRPLPPPAQVLCTVASEDIQMTGSDILEYQLGSRLPLRSTTDIHRVSSHKIIKSKRKHVRSQRSLRLARPRSPIVKTLHAVLSRNLGHNLAQQSKVHDYPLAKTILKLRRERDALQPRRSNMFPIVSHSNEQMKPKSTTASIPCQNPKYSSPGLHGGDSVFAVEGWQPTGVSETVDNSHSYTSTSPPSWLDVDTLKEEVEMEADAPDLVIRGPSTRPIRRSPRLLQNRFQPYPHPQSKKVLSKLEPKVPKLGTQKIKFAKAPKRSRSQKSRSSLATDQTIGVSYAAYCPPPAPQNSTGQSTTAAVAQHSVGYSSDYQAETDQMLHEPITLQQPTVLERPSPASFNVIEPTDQMLHEPTTLQPPTVVRRPLPGSFNMIAPTEKILHELLPLQPSASTEQSLPAAFNKVEQTKAAGLIRLLDQVPQHFQDMASQALKNSVDPNVQPATRSDAVVSSIAELGDHGPGAKIDSKNFTKSVVTQKQQVTVLKYFRVTRERHPNAWKSAVGLALQEGIQLTPSNLVNNHEGVLGGHWGVNFNRIDDESWRKAAGLPRKTRVSYYDRKDLDKQRVLVDEILAVARKGNRYIFQMSISEWMDNEPDNVGLRAMLNKAGFVAESKYLTDRKWIEWLLEEAPSEVSFPCLRSERWMTPRFVADVEDRLRSSQH